MVKPREHEGWIGVDLDGTLAFYEKWTKWNVFGPPIPLMADRVRAWIAEGREVRIVTARVGVFDNRTDGLRRQRCKLSGEQFSNRDMINAIQAWTFEHLGKRLMVTCSKDFNMVELWDDRAVQVVPNTGRTLAEEAEAVKVAEAGKAFGSD